MKEHYMQASHLRHEMETGMTITMYGDPIDGYDVVVTDVLGFESTVHTPDADGALYAYKTLREILPLLINNAEADDSVVWAGGQ
jgi:hypothetical protein